MKTILATLVIALSSAMLWVFSCIWRLGTHTVQEPSHRILVGETALLFAFLGFGLWAYVQEAKALRKERRQR